MPAHKTGFIALTKNCFLDSVHINMFIFGSECNSDDQ